jgi:hypothetical protein
MLAYNTGFPVNAAGKMTVADFTKSLPVIVIVRTPVYMMMLPVTVVSVVPALPQSADPSPCLAANFGTVEIYVRAGRVTFFPVPIAIPVCEIVSIFTPAESVKRAQYPPMCLLRTSRA